MHKRLAPPLTYSTPQRIRHYVYTYCILIGVPMLGFSWYVIQQNDSFARFVYPLLALYCLWSLKELISAKHPLERTEKNTLLVLGVIWLARAIHSVFIVAGEGSAASLQSIYFSYVLFCLLAYLMFTNKTALKLSAIAFATSLLFSIAHLSFGSVQSSLAQVFEFQGYLAATLGLIHALSYFKTELSESKARADIYEELAFQDSLTGLNNRRRVYTDLQHNLAIAQRYERPLSIILIDIDHFKCINDRYGHDVGDLILREFASLITPLLRQGDMWGRWGGEEFLIICPETTLAKAKSLAERLCKTIARHSFSEIPEVTASFGLSSNAHSPTLEELLKGADTMLYAAKAAGRNQVKSPQDEVPLKTASEQQEHLNPVV